MLTAIYHFEVSDLWVRSELLGARRTATVAGHSVALILPADRADFGVGSHAVNEPVLGGYTMASDSGEALATEVLMIRVEVEVDSDLKAPPDPASVPVSDADSKAAEVAVSDKSSASSQPITDPTVNIVTEGLRILHDSVSIAREFAQKYIALVRAEAGQYWLGPSEFQLRTTWLSQLIDSDGRVIPVGYNDGFIAVIHPVASALTEETHIELLRRAAEGSKPGLADQFLSDAEYAARTPLNPNLRQAVLLAAIACEIKIKDAIATLASVEQQSLVGLLLENPRDWTMAASSLFDKGMKAVCGKSLRDEDRLLYKEIDVLFQDRNKIAHRGGSSVSSDDILRKHIISARSAFEWLEEIQSESRQPR
jgi:hypothetical protein